ncbi:hypothetical protein GmHk_11G032164 [Glycine max]|nr:hypothetical protein GmHk_11G032164 [Glycine max]
MDRSWMKASHISDDYGNGVEQFLQFIEMHAPSLHGKYFYPCVKCANGRHQSLNEIRSHLICHGIIPTYTKWIWYGELPNNASVSHTESVEVDRGCQMRTCPTCGVSCNKVNNHETSDVVTVENSRSTKVCWYLPTKSWFRRFFANGHDAK